MTARTSLVETARGRGYLTAGDGVTTYSVGYFVQVFQQYVGSVATLRFVHGRLTTLSEPETAKLMKGMWTEQGLVRLTLELQDGRRVKILINDSHGTFTAEAI